ncbi:MAG: 4Fe-4S binding protein [Bacillota bacterium]
MSKIGVFICWCGTNISETVDIEKTKTALEGLPALNYIEDYQYLCSEIGQQKIADAIKNKDLSGVVVASCSPRMHEDTFRNAAQDAGLNPYLLEIANIREHCSWVHSDREKATEKAVALIRAAINKVKHNQPLTPGSIPVNKRALIIGGGIAGIQSAIDIAEAGYQVDIVERTPSIGGKMAQIDKTFPTLDCSACILTPKMVEASRHKNIQLHTYSEIAEVNGYVGNFEVEIKKKPRSINEDKCTGCGICLEKCPGKALSEFEEELNERNAIYTPFPQAVPNIPTIDRANCIKFETGKCGLCARVCPTDAINFDQKEKIIKEKYGIIITATGYQLTDPDQFGEYYYKHPDVITGLEFERIINAAGPTSGKLQRPSNSEKPDRVVFIQCVGSRDKARGHSHCSKICCMYTAKQAMLIREKYPETEVYVFYIDIRTAGKGFEEFQRRAQEDYGVNYVKGMVGKVFPGKDRLTVEAIDAMTGEFLKLQSDLVILAPASIPDENAGDLSRQLGISQGASGFFTEAHPKLKPVETQTAGIFLAGACQGPKDIPETVAQASGAAAKAIGILSKDSLVNNPCVAKVNQADCSSCFSCKEVCPYGAIEKEETENYGLVAKVNEALCQGCGACTVTCRSSTVNLKGFSNIEILSEVDAICL